MTRVVRQAASGPAHGRLIKAPGRLKSNRSAIAPMAVAPSADEVLKVGPMAMTDEELAAKLQVTVAGLHELLGKPGDFYYELLKGFGRDVHRDLAIHLGIEPGALPDAGSKLDSAVKLWELATSDVGPGLDALKREILPKLH